MELIKDYELEVHYHPGKANVVAEALSRKSYCNCTMVRPLDLALCCELERLNLEIIQQGSLNNIVIKSTIRDQIIAAQANNRGLILLKRKVRKGKKSDF